MQNLGFEENVIPIYTIYNEENNLPVVIFQAPALDW